MIHRHFFERENLVKSKANRQTQKRESRNVIVTVIGKSVEQIVVLRVNYQ